MMATDPNKSPNYTTTISHADKIIVFDNGRVVKQGTHKDFLSNNGYYARLAGVR